MRPSARQIREMAVWLIPVAAAADRVDQRESWRGPRPVCVLAITSATCSSVIIRGALAAAHLPARSAGPAGARPRHLRTVSRVTSKVSGHPDNDGAVYMLSCNFYR